jgi:hypothetical protein
MNDLDGVWIDWEVSFGSSPIEIFKAISPRPDFLVHNDLTVFARFFPQPNLNPAGAIYLR